jgi:hypothetical protein
MKWVLKGCLFVIASCIFSTGVYAFQGGSGGGKGPKKPETTASPKPSPTPRATGPKATPTPALLAELSVNSFMPGCEVLIDGQVRGTTNGTGVLQIPGLKPKDYRVVVRKRGYEELPRTVTLGPGIKASEEFRLTPLNVSFTVSVTNVADARIDISNGVGSYEGQAVASVRPGTYIITVKKAGFRSETRTVEVRPNEPYSLPISLEKVRVEDLLPRLESHFANNNLDEVITGGLSILAIKPDEARANLRVGQSYYLKTKYLESVPFLTRAISLGEEVTIPVLHHHGSEWTTENLDRADLTIKKGEVRFSPSCGNSFVAPLQRVDEIRTEKRGRLHLRVSVQQANNKEKRQEYNLHPRESILFKRTPESANSMIGVACNDGRCPAAAEALYSLLMQAKK